MSLCVGKTKKGDNCQRSAYFGIYCWQHDRKNEKMKENENKEKINNEKNLPIKEDFIDSSFYKTNRDKIRGGFLGLALGDAIGAPFEFRYSYPLSQYTDVIKLPIIWKARYSPVQKSTIGQVTDDTTMSIALLTSIKSNKDWIEDEVITSYLTWANSGIKFLGRNTRSLLKGIKTINGYKKRYQNTDLSNTQSNGSLMRAFPLVLLFSYFSKDEVFKKAINDTKLTNPSLVNQDCVLIYLEALWYISQNIQPNDFVPKLYDKASSKELKEVIHQVLNGVDRDITKNKGWILHSMFCALKALLLVKTKSFSEIMKWVILKGGDTDTNGAISGSLIGFYFGEKEMLKDESTAKNIKIILESEYSKGDFPLDNKYHPATVINHVLK